MRVALLKRWPALMSEYGMQPFDIGRYTPDEIREIVRHQDERYKQMRAQQRSRGR